MMNNARQLSRSLVGIYHWRAINYERFGFVNQRNYERFGWRPGLLAGDLGRRDPAPMADFARYSRPGRLALHATNTTQQGR